MLKKDVMAEALMYERHLTKFGILTIIILILAIFTALIRMPINILKNKNDGKITLAECRN